MDDVNKTYSGENTPQSVLHFIVVGSVMKSFSQTMRVLTTSYSPELLVGDIRSLEPEAHQPEAWRSDYLEPTGWPLDVTNI